MTNRCKGCGKQIPKLNLAKKPRKFCSVECHLANWDKSHTRTGVTKTCLRCGDQFYVQKSRELTAKYCSGECFTQTPEIRKAKTAFFAQRSQSRNRGIDWDLSFEQWFDIWKESGRWDKRGRDDGKYVMARFGDRGPYAIDNVKIVTSNVNMQERKKLKGEQLVNAKLTEKDVRKIRVLLDRKTQEEIALMFGVSSGLISHIKNRTAWRHVK